MRINVIFGEERHDLVRVAGLPRKIRVAGFSGPSVKINVERRAQ